MHTYIRRFFRLGQIGKLGFVGFLSSFGIALVGTIWSIYLESYLHNPSYIGFISTIFMIISLISYIVLIPIIQRFGKSFLFLLSLIFYFISYFILSLATNVYLIIFIGVIISVFASLRGEVFGIIIADKSRKKEVSKNEGAIYTFFNLAWLIGPLVAGFIAKLYGFNKVFMWAAGFLLLSLILFKEFDLKDKRKSRVSEQSFFSLIKEFFSNKQLFYVYLISGGISLWWAFIYIYGPIYIIEQGFGREFVGIFLFSVAIPLVLLEYVFGKLASKIGMRKVFVLGYLLMGVSAIICFFVSNPFVLFGFVLLASVGASMLEPTTEAYFFDITPASQRDKFYGVYNTTIDVFYSLSTFLAGLVLLWFSFNYLFLLFGVILILMAGISMKVRNVVEEK